MTISPSKLHILVAAVTSFMGGLLWSENPTIDGAFISVAQARIGRPLTPMSYAGVARRTTRRAVVYGGPLPQPLLALMRSRRAVHRW